MRRAFLLIVLICSAPTFSQDEFFAAPNGKSSHKDSLSPYKYFYKDSLIGLIKTYDNSMREVICEPVEFVHYNPDIPYWIKVEKDSILLEIQDLKLKVGRQGKIIIKDITRYYNDPVKLKISLFNHDQKFGQHEEVLLDVNKKDYPTYKGYFEEKGDKIIVQDLSKYRWHTYPKADPHQGELTHDQESTASSIWQKKNGRWELATPYYASIEECGVGFIARTPHTRKEVFVMTQNGWGDVIYRNNSSRFLLLTKELRNKSFMDHYDFSEIRNTEKGLIIKSPKGYFFVDNSGAPITEDKWEYMNLNGNRLSMKIYEIYEYDPDTGFSKFDKNGEPIIKKEGEIKVINLD